MNNKTNLLEDYLNFVDSTKKQNAYSERVMFLFAIITSLFLFFSFSNTSTNNTFSLEQISKTENLDSKLILRQYKLELMARFMEIKPLNPKLKESQIVKELG